MTDDRRYYILNPIFPGDEITLMRPRERSTWTGSVPLSPMGRAQIMFLLGRPYIPEVVGHDPQKLLPSPQHFGRDQETFGQQFILQMAHSLGLTYDEISRDYGEDKPEPEVTRWKKAVIVVGDNPHDVANLIALYAAMPNVLGIDIDIQPSSGVLPGDLFNVGRWNESDASPLEDIARWRDAVFRKKPMNRQIETYAPGMDHTDIFAGLKPVAKKAHKGYLKHDPTKNHSRRRRK